MWRRHGNTLYAVMVLAVLLAQTIGLIVVSLGATLRVTGAISYVRLVRLAELSLALGAVALFALSVYLVISHITGSRRQRRDARGHAEWTQRWMRVVFQGEPSPSGRLIPHAMTTLLNLRETLGGPEGAVVAHLLVHYGVGDILTRQLASRRIGRRLDALEGLAKARLVDTIPALLVALRSPVEVVGVMAARSLGRTLSAIEAPGARTHAAGIVARALLAQRLPAGIVEEALLLADDASVDLVAELLACGPLEPAYLRVVLEVIGYRRDRRLYTQTVHYLNSSDPEEKAAALRMCSLMGRLGRFAHRPVLEACEHPVEFVRVQAVRVAALLPPAVATQLLWEKLGDPSWWVRKRAAESLLAVGAPGSKLLRRAATGHPDRYGRDMAVQVLLDAALITQDRAQRLLSVRVAS